MDNSGFQTGAWEMENFANAYRNWLLDTMHADGYSILFDILYDTEFTWKLPEDERRASAGRYLRERFEAMEHLSCRDEWTEWPCSFLEMLVALAYSMESILYNPEYGESTYIWFWTLMENLGLAALDDDMMLGSPQKQYRYVDAVCRQVCERTYDRYGHGGLFPLNSSPEDQRKVEIWFQMQSYILENMDYLDGVRDDLR